MQFASIGFIKMRKADESSSAFRALLGLSLGYNFAIQIVVGNIHNFAANQIARL
jgi:hypothetical protein